MRKLISCLLLACGMITAVGCKMNRAQAPNMEEQNTFDIKAATNLISTYMGALMKQDYQSLNRLYTSEISKGNQGQSQGSTGQDKTDMKVKGYNVEEVSELGRAGMFKVKVASSNLNSPVASLDEYTIKVVKDGTDYKISEIKTETEREAFVEKNGIRTRSKNNIKTDLVIDSTGLPRYTFSKQDKANLYKESVPRSNFGVMNLSYDGNSLALSTHEKDAFVAIVKIEEAQAVQGGGGGKQGGGEGGGGQGGDQGGDQGGGGQQQGGGAEKPVGKDITALDYIKDASIEFMSFSQDQKFLMVQYKKPTTGSCIRLYSTENGDLAPLAFEETYPLDKVDVVFSSFDKDVMNYEVRPTTTDTQATAAGKYQVSLKDFKIKKL